jgi:hypothetical protein
MSQCIKQPAQKEKVPMPVAKFGTLFIQFFSYPLELVFTGRNLGSLLPFYQPASWLNPRQILPLTKTMIFVCLPV